MGALPGLCLATALASTFVPGPHFTLAWVHSIEKVRWEEDYRVEVRGQAHGAAHVEGRAEDPVQLVATQARVRGSAAGMEPPPGAVLREGWFAYTPQQTHPQELRLSRSEFVPDYELCPGSEGCRPMHHWLPSDGGVTTVRACLKAQ